MSDYTPYLPYDGTEGWSGSETSKKRAGIKGKNQKPTIDCLLSRGKVGLTTRELLVELSKIPNPPHHGGGSGTLSTLHKGEIVCRLTEVRGGMKVYVLPEFVDGRPTEPQGRKKKVKTCQHCGEEL